MRGERWEPTRIEGPQGFRARGFQSASHTARPSMALRAPVCPYLKRQHPPSTPFAQGDASPPG